MAGKKETTDKTTTKKSKKQISEVVEINDIVVSDSEESGSCEVSLKSNTKINKPEPESISESESQGEEDEEVEDTEGEEEVEVEGSEVEESGGEEVEESEGEKEEVVKKIEKKNGGEKSKGKGNEKMSDKKEKSKGKGKEVEKDESESGMYKLPMRRISRIIKDENPDMRITHEATFLVNKATEKFLELFAKEAYVCAFVDRKNQVAYNHLSSVVAKRSKLDFLSDFVPEKVKAEVALRKLTMNEK